MHFVLLGVEKTELFGWHEQQTKHSQSCPFSSLTPCGEDLKHPLSGTGWRPRSVVHPWYYSCFFHFFIQMSTCPGCSMASCYRPGLRRSLPARRNIRPAMKDVCCCSESLEKRREWTAQNKRYVSMLVTVLQKTVLNITKHHPAN